MNATATDANDNARLSAVRRSGLPAYYLGRPAQMWLDALRRPKRAGTDDEVGKVKAA